MKTSEEISLKSNEEIPQSTEETAEEVERPISEYVTCKGKIKFRGYGLDATTPASYIGVSGSCGADLMTQLFEDDWKLKPPKLIISVIGGVRDFFMETNLKNFFKRDLIKAASSTEAWIITGGLGSGVTKLVGEAVGEHNFLCPHSERNIVALGIAPWDVIENKESLVNEHAAKDSFLVNYRRNKNSDNNEEQENRILPLDHNHTHFILVKNKQGSGYGSEIPFRFRLQRYISEKKKYSFSFRQNFKVPVISLIVEGSLNAIQNAASAVESDQKILVIKGSGKAADLISYAYQKTMVPDDESKTVYPPDFESEFSKEVEYNFGEAFINNPHKFPKCLSYIKIILNKRSFVTIFLIDDDDKIKGIDQAIFISSFEANKSDPESQLTLAIECNRHDIARTKIFSRRNNLFWVSTGLDNSLVRSLMQDKAKFVQIFLENSVYLRHFLRVDQLQDLYWNSLQDESRQTNAKLLRNLLRKAIQKKAIKQLKQKLPDLLLSYIGKIFCSFVKESENIYSSKRYMTNKASKLNDNSSIEESTNENITVELPERDLFLWSLAFNKQNTAFLFWKLGRDHIGAALTAASIMKGLSNEARKQQEFDLAQDFSNQAVEWESKAVGIVNECFRRNKNYAHKLLIRELADWGNSTVLSLGYSLQSMDLISHSCCQTKLNIIWKGEIALETGQWSIFLSILLPILIPYLIKFTKERNSEDSIRKRGSIKFTNSSASKQQITFEKNSDDEDNDMISDNDEDRYHQFRRFGKRFNLKRIFDKTDNHIGIFRRLRYFYTAPISKFWCHTISYIIFLGVFSYFVLTDLHPWTKDNRPSSFEFIIWIWSTTLFIEEIRQIATTNSPSLGKKLKKHVENVWNKFDLLAYFLFMVSVIIRNTLPIRHFMWVRSFYCISLVTFYLRFLHVFYAFENIGPKVIMIRRMLTDLLFFIAILLVFIVTYGVASHALLFPNTPASWSLLKNVIYIPYWQMYGDLFLDHVEGNSDNCNSTIGSDNPCPKKSVLAVVLFAIYMVITNVLLLNLLIAMFANTFERVQENSEKVWKYYRYNLIQEYFDRPTLAPPFIILTHIWRLLKNCYLKAKSRQKKNTYLRSSLPEEETKKMALFERTCTENYFLIQNTKSY
ncbi:DgyrCDS4036 [Dimorphilus gyrociliatus]|uniref:DgyrCDS4036 n=2 Tax=Dimorphilus gyrociliatus TaxID=2664684 RepID=A0A7I8VHV3_9ANNE|nr:DgyrCDS4036 [Dimorphilus gyrociliatus]